MLACSGLRIHLSVSSAGYIWPDLKQNIEILEELEVAPIQDTISNYKTDWRDHVNRMSRSRLPKVIKYD
jgi:hypothetical protein